MDYLDYIQMVTLSDAYYSKVDHVWLAINKSFKTTTNNIKKKKKFFVVQIMITKFLVDWFLISAIVLVLD